MTRARAPGNTVDPVKVALLKKDWESVFRPGPVDGLTGPSGIGHNCVVFGQAATCGATFTGWTGVTNSGGWVPFPGTRQGIWTVQINYTGHPAFGGTTPQVTIVGGKWNFLFLNGLELQGKVVSWTVTWPQDNDSSVDGSNCGNGVAVAQPTLTLKGGASATVQHTLIVFADLLGAISMVGFVVIVCLLFQGAQASAAADTERRRP